MMLITSNEKKIEEFKAALGEIEVRQVEYSEIKAAEPCDVAKSAAKQLAEELNEVVIVEDSGLFIDALKDFPGTNTHFSDERIGNVGLLKLMEGVKERQCEYRSAIGYCEPGKEPLCFLGVEQGKIAEKMRGSKGWGQDSLFIPQGSEQTYGEKREVGDVNVFRHRAIEKLKAYLLSLQK